MAETRQGALPKYSILQRIDLGEKNDLTYPSNDVEYVFTLDPSFTFAKGSRKSIAIRKVDIYNVIPEGQTKMAFEALGGGLEVDIRYGSGSTHVMSFKLANVNYECSNDKLVSMNNFGTAIGNMLLEKFNSNTNFNGKFKDPIVQYSEKYNKLTIKMETQPNITVTDLKAYDSHPYWAIERSTVYSYYNTTSTALLRFNVQFAKTYITFELYFPDEFLDIRRASVCGNINPWTKNNIIAPLQYDSDHLSKVYPYSGNTEARFWFINDDGKKIRWKWVRGYIDLELIIDNSDTYAMDT